LPDDVIAEAAERAGLVSFSTTRRFRDGARKESLYSHWDGHLNGAGHRLFAESIAPAVEACFSPPAAPHCRGPSDRGE
jgi:hypothetical protein